MLKGILDDTSSFISSIRFNNEDWKIKTAAIVSVHNRRTVDFFLVAEPQFVMEMQCLHLLCVEATRQSVHPRAAPRATAEALFSSLNSCPIQPERDTGDCL